MTAVLNVKQAAVRTGLSAHTLNNMRCSGTGPRYLKLGRAVRYSENELEAWLSARAVTSTSQQAAA